MLEPGASISGKYQLERQLGEGGMGVVWLARHVELGEKRVAIKFLLNSMSKNLIERFRREALLASRIHSRHVVQVLDYGEHLGAPYLVMECLDGHDLRHLLDRQRSVDVGSVVAIITQAARGLQKAHDAGMIHRDIKPENLFLCRDEDGGLLVKILDFGIAKSLEADSGTATGMMIGTAYYMSPEQYQGLKAIDRRTDLWSLACVVYEMLVGARVFEGNSIIAIGMHILAEKRPVPSQLAPGLPSSFDIWFAQALHPNPASRFNSALEFADALASALGMSSPSASFSFDPNAISTRQPPSSEFTTTALANSEVRTSTKAPGSRTTWIAGALAVALIAAAGVTGAVAWRSSAKGAAQPAASPPTDTQSASSAVATVPDAAPAAELSADNAWAELQLSKAEAERDPAEKRRILSEVAASGADDSRRSRARALIDTLAPARSTGKVAKPTGTPKTTESAPPKPATTEPAKTDSKPPASLPDRF